MTDSQDYRRGQFYRFVDPMYGLPDPEDVPVDDCRTEWDTRGVGDD